jgi:hypothetical protein
VAVPPWSTAFVASSLAMRTASVLSMPAPDELPDGSTLVRMSGEGLNARSGQLCIGAVTGGVWRLLSPLVRYGAYRYGAYHDEAGAAPVPPPG